MCEEVPQPQPCYVLQKKPQSLVQTFPVPYLTYLNIQIIKCVSYIVHPTGISYIKLDIATCRQDKPQ